MTYRQNRKNRHGNTQKQQRGVALVAALVALVLVAAITAGMMILSTTESSISANFRDEQAAFFASKAGMEEARDRLGALRTAALLPTTVPGTVGGALYVVNPNPNYGETQANILTTYGDDEICKETQATAVPCAPNPTTGRLEATPGGWETTTLNSNVYLPPGGQLPWKWVRINLKLNNQNNALAPSYNVDGNPADASVVCWNGINEFPDPGYNAGACTNPSFLPVYVLTGMAVTPRGSRRMVQIELAEVKFPFTAPGALTMLDSTTSNASFSSGSSAQWNSNGNDAAGCGQAAGATNVHGIAVDDNTDQTNVDNGLKRPGLITGIGPNLADGANVVNVAPTTAAQPGDGTLPLDMQTVDGLQNLVSTIKADVTQPALNCTAGCSGLANPGTQASPQIIYVNGSLTLSGNTQGYGILVVTGTLTMKGTVGWNGIVLVVGQGDLQTDGTVQYNGAVVVANTTNAAGAPLATFGPPTVSVNGGGHGGIQYSSGCVNMALRNFNVTFTETAVRELMR